MLVYFLLIIVNVAIASWYKNKTYFSSENYLLFCCIMKTCEWMIMYSEV